VVQVDDTYRHGYRSHNLKLPKSPETGQVNSSNFTRSYSILLEQELRRAWKPTGLLVGRSPTDMAVVGKSDCEWLNSANSSDRLLGQESIPGFFSQFLKVKLAWGLVRAEEFQSGQRYDWLIRIRSDVVLFSPVPPLENMAGRAVFVPRNGMANNPDAAFRNDQVFLCPRDNCEEYFSIADLYSHCDPKV